MVQFTIRETREEDWEPFKALRLEMLRDTPLAYTETLEAAERLTELGWRTRAGRGSSGNGVRFVAITDVGDWIGIMGGYVEPDVGGPMLVGVYVQPRFRGDRHGVTGALLDAVETWAAARASVLTLEVHEDNPRAIAAYEKRGYVATGRTLPYPLDPSQRELEMKKRL